MSAKTESQMACEELAKAIKEGIKMLLEEARFDKSVTARISKVDGTNYEAKYAGKAYFVSALNGDVYNIDDIVMVTFMQSDYSNGVIMGKK